MTALQQESQICGRKQTLEEVEHLHLFTHLQPFGTTDIQKKKILTSFSHLSHK